MEIELRTLTPLWTGGVETGKVDRIHETGILGSLRWWYEALVRGLGAEACDPTTQKCLFDPEKPAGGLCRVCEVFGATGWRRRFRLLIRDSTHPDDSVTERIQIRHSHTDKEGKTKIRTSTWYFPKNLNDKPRSGTLSIQIQSLARNFQPEVIAGLVQFIADWAAIGARAQMGFGVFEPASRPLDTRPLYQWLTPVAGNHRDPQLPSLQNIFLARIKPKDAQQAFKEQETFNLKYDLRQLFTSKKLRHFIMGTVKEGRMAAKVKMSRPFGDGLMHIWGWIPEEASVYHGPWSRNTVVATIHQHLCTNYTLQHWREMNSPRDTVARSTGDAQVFLRSLLGLEENDDAV